MTKPLTDAESIQLFNKVMDIIAIMSPDAGKALGISYKTIENFLKEVETFGDNHPFIQLMHWIDLNIQKTMGQPADAVILGLLIGYSQGVRNTRVAQILNGVVAE